MGDGLAYNGDSIRDWLGGLSILDGQLPERGPACGKLGFFLGLLYYHLVASILAVDRSTEWIAAFLCGWRAVEPILFFHLVRRLASRRVALTAAALYVGSDAIRSIGHLFTHSAFMMPFELAGLLALEAHLRGRRFALAVTLGALAAALQFHTSAVSVFFVAVLATLVAGGDRPWSEAIVAWLAFLAPALPLYGEPAFHANLAQHGVAGALLLWLTANNALLPSLLGVIALARPSVLRRGKSLAAVAAVTSLWALWFFSHRDPGETSAVLRLFNFELRPPPVFSYPPTAVEQIHAVWIWRFFQFFETGPGPAAWLYAVAAAAGTVAALRSALATNGSPELNRHGARFVLAWLSIVGGLGVFSNLRAPTAQPQYVVHLAPPLVVLIAFGVVTLADRLAAWCRRWWSTRVRHPHRAAAIAALATAIIVGAPTVVPAVLFVSQLPFARLLLVAALLPAALQLRGDRITGADHASLAYDRATASLARYVTGDLGLGRDAGRRVHGATGPDNWWGDVESAWTIWMLTHDVGPPDRRRDRTLHFRLRVASGGEIAPPLLPVPETSLVLEPYPPALRAEEAQIVVSPADGPAPLPLPHRVNFIQMPSELASALGLAPPMRQPPPTLRITIPREAPLPESGEAVRVLLHQGASPTPDRPCRIDAKLDGRPLPPPAETRGMLQQFVFRLPRHPHRAAVELDLDGCYPDYLDVFDER